MPEGPEVRWMADQLQKFIIGRNLTQVEILGGRYARHPETYRSPPTLPLKVTKVSTKGKFLTWTLESDSDGSIHYLASFMGLTGLWTTSENPHNRIQFTFEDGVKLFFNDTRNFGTIAFWNLDEVTEKESSLGLDFLGPDGKIYEDNPEKFLTYCKRFKGEICTLLMEQKFLCGVGNYIRAEALYRAKISPYRFIETLTDQEKEALRESVLHVMRESYRCGGATLRNYQDLNGQVGSYFHQLKVYGKKQDPLGNPVLKKLDSLNRTIWWVPAVQDTDPDPDLDSDPE